MKKALFIVCLFIVAFGESCQTYYAGYGPGKHLNQKCRKRNRNSRFFGATPEFIPVTVDSVTVFVAP